MIQGQKGSMSSSWTEIERQHVYPGKTVIFSAASVVIYGMLVLPAHVSYTVTCIVLHVVGKQMNVYTIINIQLFYK